MNSIIETKDLKLWYGDHQVLKGITMDIPNIRLLGNDRKLVVVVNPRFEKH